MSKQANMTLIGVFVTGALALLITAILIFGGGSFFRRTFSVVLFFDGSVKGLSVGSPVMFRGVKVGTVSDIRLIMGDSGVSVQTPVIVELEPDRWSLSGSRRGDSENLTALINSGMRAQLQMQSVVTGQLIISLDFFPDKPAKYVGLLPKYPEIPTVPTSLEELSRTIQDLPVKDILTKLDSVMDGLNKVVNSPDTQQGVKELHLALQDTRKLIQNINEHIEPLTSSMNSLVENTNVSLTEARNTMSGLRADTKEIVLHTKNTLDSMQSVLSQTERTMANFSDNSLLVYEMNKALKEVSQAARSIRQLSEYLERHPEALLKGKSKEEGAIK